MVALTCASLVLLAGCGGGSGDNGGGSESPTITSPQVQGYAVKGPLKNAPTSLYTINLSAPDLKGALLDTGITDDAGSITNLEVPATLTPGPFLLEVTGGTELDNTAPVIPTLRTIVQADQIADQSATQKTKTPIVVTPLTTLVTEMARVSAARKNNAASGTVTLDNFFTTDGGGEVGAQVSILKSALGLGLLDSIDIFTYAPLITATNDASIALQHRTVIETNAALFVQILAAVGGQDADAVFAAYAQDLADGAIDGKSWEQSLDVFSGHEAEVVTILSLSPDALMALPVPGVADKTVAELNVVLAQQAGLEPGQAPAALTITESTVPGEDSDGDGKVDTLDIFPNNGSEWADSDTDCATAFSYTDADYLTASAGSGCGDNSDFAPQDPLVQNSCQAAPGNSDPNKPVANAGTAITRTFNDSSSDRTITLAGGNSCDPNNDELTYQWVVVSVPMAGSKELLGKDNNGNGNAITKENMLSNSTTETPSFEANFAGEYVFALTVSDGTNTSEADTVTVNIDKGYYVDIDGKFMFLSAIGGLLLLAIPARRRKQKASN